MIGSNANRIKDILTYDTDNVTVYDFYITHNSVKDILRIISNSTELELSDITDIQIEQAITLDNSKTKFHVTILTER